MRNPDYYVRYDDFGYNNTKDQKKLIIRDWIKVIFVLACAFFVFFWCRGIVSTNNELKKLEKEADLAFENVQATIQERLEMISYLEVIANRIEQQKGSVFSNIYKTSTQIENARTPEELYRIDKEITNSFNTFVILVENNPNIAENEDYIFYKERIELEAIRISDARESYNNIAKRYNEIVRHFPGSFIAKIFGFKPREEFDD